MAQLWLRLARKPRHGALLPGVKDSNSLSARGRLTARDSEEDVDFDSDSLNPHVSYMDEHTIQHDIWFLDAVTALNEMRAAQTLGIETFALWRLGCGGPFAVEDLGHSRRGWIRRIS